VDQPRTEIILKFRNSVADAGLGTLEAPSRAGKPALLNHLHEETGIVQVNHYRSPHWTLCSLLPLF
jgi:hypothetical protein